MKKLLSAVALLLCALAHAATPLSDVQLAGSANQVKSGATLTVVSGGALVLASGSVFTLPSASITWASVNKTGSSFADFTTRSASDISSGTLPDARFPATLPVASGVNLTALNATNLASGTVAVARGGTGASTAIGALDALITAEATIASATTTAIGAATTRNLSITGTTTITGFGTIAAGVMRFGRFAGILTLTHNATSLILPGGASITTAANDRFVAISLGSGNWLVYSYTRADGTALVGSGGMTNPMTTAEDLIVGGVGGAPARLPKGSDGQVLKMASGAITWGTDSTGGGGGGTGTLTLARWTAVDNQPPAATYATFDTRNAIAVLDFDASTAESAVFVGVIPEAADFTTGITVRLVWMATSATSGNVIWTTAFERGNTDLDSDSFATGIDSAAAAANGTSGIVTTTSINHSDTQIDGVAAGDLVRLKITRKAADGSDTMTGDAELITVEIRQR